MLGKSLTNEEKLDAIYEMTRDNHEILLSIRRQQYLAGFFRVLYWFAVLGVLGGSYYYIRPLILTLTENGTKVERTVSELNKLRDNLPEARLINGMVKMFSATSTGEAASSVVVDPQ